MNGACEPLLTVSHLSKRIGQELILEDISFTARPGEVILILGANGAGKSTLLRLIAGLLRADSGSVVVHTAEKRIGYVGHSPCLYTEFTVEENLRFFAQLFGAQLDEGLFERWQLIRIRDRRVHDLSKGEGTRATLARALLGEPSLLLLDEPTSALDDGSVEQLTRTIAERSARGHTVILVSHDLERIANVASRVLVLSRGTIMSDAHGSERELAIANYRRGNR